MDWMVIFMHDLEPAVRVFRNIDEAEAEELLRAVQMVYDDPEARLIQYDIDNDDADQVRTDLRLFLDET